MQPAQVDLRSCSAFIIPVSEGAQCAKLERKSPWSLSCVIETASSMVIKEQRS